MIKKVIQNKQIEEVLFCSLFLSVFLIYSKSLFVQFTLPKLAFLRLFTLLILILWTYQLIRGKTKSLPKTVLISTLMLMLWWIGTTFYALHLPTALDGFNGRYNGLWSHLTYLLLFVICSSLPLNFTRIENIFKLMVLALVPVSLFAIYQLYDSSTRPCSTIGNPVILAALLGLALPFSLIFYLQSKRNNIRLVWGTSTAVIVFAILSTLSRGPWVGSQQSKTTPAPLYLPAYKTEI